MENKDKIILDLCGVTNAINKQEEEFIKSKIKPDFLHVMAALPNSLLNELLTIIIKLKINTLNENEKTN